MYTKGEIDEVPTGWSIDIRDPQGDHVVTLHYIMTRLERFTKRVEENLHSQADSLLSHLNRQM